MKKVWKKILIVWIIIGSLLASALLFFHQETIATVMIDPGHGGYDVGAIGYDQTTYEKDLTLSLGRKIGYQIRKVNPKIKVVYTRNKDTVPWPSNESEDLKYRVQMAENEKADFYLSIHMNASQNTNASGYSFHIKQDDLLSQSIAERMDQKFEKIHWSESRGIIHQPLYVVDHLEHSMLLETGFITNPEELRALKNPIKQRKIAKAIAQAICEILTK